jgi:hypothetical protein
LTFYFFLIQKKEDYEKGTIGYCATAFYKMLI